MRRIQKLQILNLFHSLDFVPLGKNDGTWRAGEIKIDEKLPNTLAAWTLFHEIAHAYHHLSGSPKRMSEERFAEKVEMMLADLVSNDDNWEMLKAARRVLRGVEHEIDTIQPSKRTNSDG